MQQNGRLGGEPEVPLHAVLGATRARGQPSGRLAGGMSRYYIHAPLFCGNFGLFRPRLRGSLLTVTWMCVGVCDVCSLRAQLPSSQQRA